MDRIELIDNIINSIHIRMDRIVLIDNIINSIHKLNITEGVYTTYDKAMMDICKDRVIKMLREEYYGNNKSTNMERDTSPNQLEFDF